MRLSESPRIEFLLGNCMDYMKDCKDKQFELCIVDPPYGHGAKIISGNPSRSVLAKSKDYGGGGWNDECVDGAYFANLSRIGENQIIWGRNYYDSPPSPCWIIWDKENGENDFADAELAWASFQSATRIFRFHWQGMFQGDMKNKE